MSAVPNLSLSELTSGLNFGLALAGLAILYILYRGYRIDKTRDEIFALRDEMFDFAWEAQLLGHPAYTRLRVIMNSVLRFAHKMTILRFVTVMVLTKSINITPNPHQEWMEGIATLPSDKAKKLEEFHSRMGVLIFAHMCETSILLRILGAAFAAAQYAHRMRKPGTAILIRVHRMEQFEAQAFTFRE